jgi:hypothetical protein
MNRVNVTGIGSGILLVRKVSVHLEVAKSQDPINSTPTPGHLVPRQAHKQDEGVQAWRRGRVETGSGEHGLYLFLSWTLHLLCVFYWGRVQEKNKDKARAVREVSPDPCVS